jgi:biopolymer transport protein ExbB
MLWVIAACGLVGFLVFVDRAVQLHRAQMRSDDFLPGIQTVLKRGNVDEALAICRETPGPVPQVVKAAILHRGDTPEGLRAALEDARVSEVSRMERRLVVVSTVAQLAPLLGLLGTLLGLLDFLTAMQRDLPLVHSAKVLGAIQRAVIAVCAGLSVAIPAQVGSNLLGVRVDRIVLDMERAASEMIAFFAEEARLAKGG